MEKLTIDANAYTNALRWAAENKEFEKVKFLLAIGEEILIPKEEASD